MALRAMRGDESAFASLQKRYAGGILKFFMQRAAGRTDVAEELAHTTWVSVWKALAAGRYDPARARISTFVYAVATKAHLQFLRDRRRAEGRRVSLEEQRRGEQEFSDTPGETGLAELIEAVRECLDAESEVLTAEERDLVTAVVRGETDRAVAKRLGVASSTINSRRRGAYDKIRRYLASKGHRGESGERSGFGGG